jgi:hypothetical protein
MRGGCGLRTGGAELNTEEIGRLLKTQESVVGREADFAPRDNFRYNPRQLSWLSKIRQRLGLGNRSH